VIAGFLILMLTVGMYVTIGVFFKPMLNEFGWTRAVTSGPIAVSGLVNGVGSLVMGGLTDRLGPRMVVIFCGILSGIGYIMMSQITGIWQLYIFYSLLIGAGLSVMVPLMSAVARWFQHRRTVMTGIIFAGGGAGGLILPPLANWLVIQNGWRPSYLVLGIVFLVIIIIAALFLKRSPAQPAVAPADQPRVEAGGTPGSYTFKTSLQTLSFWLLMVSNFFFGFTVGTIQIHLIPYATDINVTPTSAATLYSVMSAIVIIGCIVLGTVGDRLGNKRLFVGTFAGFTVGLIWLGFMRELWMLYVFALIFGLCNGSGFAQATPLTARIFGLRSLGIILGMLMLGQAVGVAAGGFLAGYIYDINRSYQLMFLICGTGSFIAALSTSLVKPIKSAA
jgi:MFS family permease